MSCQVPEGYAERIALLSQIAARRAADDALQLRTLAALAQDVPPWLDETAERRAVEKQWVREEISCALAISSVTVAGMLAEAAYVTEVVPEAVDALAAGRVTARQVSLLASGICGLDRAVATAVAQRVLSGSTGQTVTAFQRTVRRAIAALDQRGAQQRHEDAYQQRRVALRHGEDGMSQLWAYLPSDGAQALYDAVQAIAVGLAHPADSTEPAEPTAAPAEPDTRTADQYRADALCSLACTPTGQPPRASIQVTVPLSTLLDLDDTPAELTGVGPITAEHARQIAYRQGATWRRLVTDPIGRLIDLSTTRYRPPKRLTDHVTTRDQTCRFPHCHRRAERCELDHRTPWPAGQTCPSELQPLCTRHHHVKHDAAWHAHLLDDGTTRWTSPLGHTYDVPPYRHPINPELGSRPETTRLPRR